MGAGWILPAWILPAWVIGAYISLAWMVLARKILAWIVPAWMVQAWIVPEYQGCLCWLFCFAKSRRIDPYHSERTGLPIFNTLIA